MSDYWTDRALPVLRALDAATDEHFAQTRILSLGHNGAKQTLRVELSDGAVYDTILQLADAGYVEYAGISFFHPGGAHVMGLSVSGRGLQVLGQWPRFELLVSPVTLAALLEALAEYVPEEEAKPMHRAATLARGMMGSALKSVAVGAGSQLARHALGLP